MDWYKFPRSHIVKLEEHIAVQQRTFTRWINMQLEKVQMTIADLDDLRSGVRLIALLSVLTGEKLNSCKGKMRLHKIENARVALDLLERRNVKMVNIRADEIVDGNEKLILSLVWHIISHFYLPPKDVLLQWAREAVRQCPNGQSIEIKDFTSSWRDGTAFKAIISRYRPDLVYGVLSTECTSRENLEKAFAAAETGGIARLLEPEDVDCESPDERSIIMYVASLYHTFQIEPQSEIVQQNGH